MMTRTSRIWTKTTTIRSCSIYKSRRTTRSGYCRAVWRTFAIWTSTCTTAYLTGSSVACSKSTSPTPVLPKWIRSKSESSSNSLLFIWPDSARLLLSIPSIVVQYWTGSRWVVPWLSQTYHSVPMPASIYFLFFFASRLTTRVIGCMQLMIRQSIYRALRQLSSKNDTLHRAWMNCHWKLVTWYRSSICHRPMRPSGGVARNHSRWIQLFLSVKNLDFFYEPFYCQGWLFPVRMRWTHQKQREPSKQCCRSFAKSFIIG